MPRSSDPSLSSALASALVVGLLLSVPVRAQPSCGDCDLGASAGITVLDVLVAAEIAVAVLTPLPDQLCACDVDSSGSIDVIDAFIMARVAAGLPVAMSCPPPCLSPAAPSCSFTTPAAGASIRGNVSISLGLADPDSPTGLTVAFTVSTDGGASFQSCTPAAGGFTNPQPAAVPVLTWSWASKTDVPVQATAMVLRATVTDGISPPGTCEITVNLDNSIRIPPMMYVATCGPSPNRCAEFRIDVATPSTAWTAQLHVSTDSGATWHNPICTPGTSAGVGSFLGVGFPGRITFFPFGELTAGGNVHVRVFASDSSTSVYSNADYAASPYWAPECSFRFLIPGATYGGVFAVDIRASDWNGGVITYTFDYSINGGTTYLPPTMAMGSLASDSYYLAPGVCGSSLDQLYRTLHWNSAADVAGTAVPVRLRLRVPDCCAGSCTTTLNILVTN